MGFYGNITNTSKTLFLFDKIYPNRYEMDNLKSVDGIYAGRYVLVEYDNETNLDTFVRVQFNNGIAYYQPGGSTSEWTELKIGKINKGDIVYEAQIDTEPSGGYFPKHCIFYVCTSELKEDKSNENEPATFDETIKGDGVPNYTINYNIDTDKYGSGRGYDSTVWLKTYINGVEKYIMIAELNTVVPTFDVSADAPTMNPVVPHFDTQSTDVYYKLHWQAPWGFRVAQADENKSDENTIWTTTIFNPSSGENETTVTEDVNAAIYFNKNAFDPLVDGTRNTEEGIFKHSNAVIDNEIKITPTGKSGNKYNKHDGTSDVEEKFDIQEMSINLPAIGNMMSDAWDIIHGPNRNNARTDNNSSLQGRLDSFKEIKVNQIPVKRAEDGTLIGSMINNAIAYNNWEDKPNDILDDDGITPAFTRDDAWIETVIDTSDLVGGVKIGDDVDLSANSGISIHHTFHATENSTSTLDKNTGEVTQSETYKETYIPVSNDATAQDDTIKLYTPYVDAKGHVVGKNIETITLPYSYRFFETKAVSGIDDADLYTIVTSKEDGDNSSEAIAVTSDLIAKSTQDTLAINPGNKWIQLKLDNEIDTLTIAHEIHAVDEIPQNTNLNNDNIESENLNDKIIIQDIEFDDAGHAIQNRKHTYTLPYGFKTITTNGTDKSNIDIDISTNSVIAENTQDTLAINAGNKWIHIATDKDNDSITFAHEVNPIITNSNGTTNMNTEVNANNEDNINIPDWLYDNAGHITHKQNHYYTLPFGFKTVIPAEQSNAVTNPEDNTNTIMANSTQDALKIASTNKWIRMSADDTSNTLSIGHEVHNFESGTPHTKYGLETDVSIENLNIDNTIEVPVIKFDEAGHITMAETHTVKIPENFDKINIITNSDNNSIKVSGTEGVIEADALTDTLTLAEGNQWITLDADVINDKVTISHYLNNINSNTNVTDFNNATSKTFKIHELAWDKAGHIIDNITHTYTLPDSIKTIAIANSGKNIVAVDATAADGALTAETLVDTATFDIGNRWLLFVADTNNDKVTLYHSAPGAETNTTKTGDETPEYGAAFSIPEIKYDEAGHISKVTTHAVTFPTPQLNNFTATESSVLTGIQMTDSGKLIISLTNADIGTRKLTGYSIGTNNADIEANDTINVAFGKLQMQIHDEKINRANAINELNYSSAAIAGQYISEVSQTNGKITVQRAVLPDYTSYWNKIASLEGIIESQDVKINNLLNIINDLIKRIEVLETYHKPEEPETPENEELENPIE